MVRWEENKEKQLIILLKPKFRINFIQKRLKYPYLRVKLDHSGSRIWKNIDGKKTIFTIANDLQNRSDVPMEQLYERVAAFIKDMENNRLIRLESAIRPDS